MQQLRLHNCTAISLNTQLQALLRTDTRNAEHNANTARVGYRTFWEELKTKTAQTESSKRKKGIGLETALVAAGACMGNRTCVIY
jgi:hypothetical protein